MQARRAGIRFRLRLADSKSEPQYQAQRTKITARFMNFGSRLWTIARERETDGMG